MQVSEGDVRVLRALAEQYAEIAALPAHDQKRAMWRRHNACEIVKPMILIDQLPWNELDVDGLLVNRVTEPFWRRVETQLRRTLYQWMHLPVDMVINPYITLPRPIETTGWGLEAHVTRLSMDETSDVQSQHMECLINDFDDLEKIKMPEITLDAALDAEIRQAAEHIFEGIIPFRMAGQIMHLGIWDTISMWMGVENCYVELMDRPELIHALMEKMTDGLIYQIGQMNALGLFDVYTNLCHCSHTFCNDLPGEDAVPHPTSHDAWAFGLAQLFTSVSPEITDVFEVQYMKRVFPLFGAIYYGCCDRLDDRLDMITKMPNIRKISCSPWSDRENFAKNLPKGYIMSNKPSPAILAYDSFDETAARKDVRRTIDAARANGVPLEMILKDVSTVRYDPKRLWRWAEIAMEESETRA